MTTSFTTPYKNLALSASAGSGKTTRLCRRYLALLQAEEFGITPDRISALTFTRKAAGEIFDRIVLELCDGSEGRLDGPVLQDSGISSSDSARLLRQFLSNLNRSMIGTLDSFVVKIAQTFPLELGIPFDFKIIESNSPETLALQGEILTNLLAESKAGESILLKAFRDATYGTEEKNFERFLRDAVVPLHLMYRFCPDRHKWGNPSLIWDDMSLFESKRHTEDKLQEFKNIVLSWIEAERNKHSKNRTLLKALDIIRTITEVLAVYNLSSLWDKVFINAIFGKLLAAHSDLRQGFACISYYSSELSFSDAAAKAMAALLDHLIVVELARSLKKTQGLYELLRIYDKMYERVTSEAACFSFTDLQYKLSDKSTALAGTAPLVLSRQRGANRLFIDYRLDSSLDHWLLDEFQDTSDLQWTILRNLIDELLQDSQPDRPRSLFYVGDVKQSIYRWRGGNPKLFSEILDYYSDAIGSETMTQTYRCSKPIVKVVNRVFSNLGAISLPKSDEGLPEQTLEDWEHVWEEHHAAPQNDLGCAVLLEAGKSGSPAFDRYHLIARLLKEIKPVSRGISVGILMRTNDACEELIHVLRQACPGINFVHEGKFGVSKNELAQVLLALIHYAAHPGDLFAWKHLEMSPLGEFLHQQKSKSGSLPLNLLLEIESQGFGGFISSWAEKLDSMVKLNIYGKQCLERLLKIAAEFDLGGSKSCDQFLDFANHYEVQEETAKDAVRILTVHQAKGLGFDMVILPQLQHQTRMNMLKADARDRSMLFAGKLYEIDWLLHTPKNEIARDISGLGERLSKLDADHCFDQLCLLYVAMTRAKRALYMIVSPQSESDSVLRPSDLLRRQLVVSEANAAEETDGDKLLYAAEGSDPEWYKHFQLCRPGEPGFTERTSAAKDAVDFSKRNSIRQKMPKAEPSAQESFKRSAGALFDPETWDVLAFGTVIHELFEQVVWLEEPVDADVLLASWRPSKLYDPKVVSDALAQFKRCLQVPEVRETFKRPAGRVELWREKSFEVVLDGYWVSGIFDRVVIRYDADGNPVQAVVLDYKSNRNLTTEADMQSKATQYQTQMSFYQKALSSILALPTAKIETKILFTVPARVFRVNQPD